MCISQSNSIFFRSAAAAIISVVTPLFLISLLLLSPGVQAAPGYVAKVVSIKGEVFVVSASTGKSTSARRGQELEAGDAVVTGTDGQAALLLSDESLVRLNKNSRFQLKQVDQSAGWFSRVVQVARKKVNSLYSLSKGEAWFRNKNRNIRVDVDTPIITAGIRGTEMNIKVTEDDVSITVLEGTVQAWNTLGKVQGTAGTEISAKPGQAPRTRVLLTPENAVQWTLTIPQLFDLRDYPLIKPGTANTRAWKLLYSGNSVDAFNQFKADGLATPDNQLGSSMALMQAGKLADARQALNALKAQYSSHPAYLLLDSYLQLQAGEVSTARRQLERLVNNQPQLAPAWSMLALAAVVLGDLDAATDAAAKAVSLRSNSPANLIIQGYVYQARFELDRSEDALEQALQLEKDNITALLNLARLKFGSGYIEEARHIVNQAISMNANNANAQNLNGFIFLAERKDEQAIAAFQAASALDSSIGEPYLGLSLVYMRQDRVESAMEAISSAVLLDPQRSLYLSYWAKMLHQLERYDKALDMLIRASSLDPRDPTPELYRALILRDLNRPAESIQALKKAIELNDFRAVYRSRLLLDQDLAVKNIDLSKVYTQLDLDTWAQAKATDSIQNDYANASAHLFYAGSLTEQDDRSLARNTENLIARILTPANLNSFNTFNNYTTFLEKPGIEGEANLMLGTQGTEGKELLLYGAAPEHNLAFQAGYFERDTHGWRDTNNEGYDSLVGYVKWDATMNDSFMASVSATDTYERDRSLQRYEYDVLAEPKDRVDGSVDRIELGYHHNFAPGSDLMLHATHIDGDSKINDYTCLLLTQPCTSNLYAELFDIYDLDLPYDQLQGMWVYKQKQHQLLLGAIIYEGEDSTDWQDYLVTSIPTLPIFPLFNQSFDLDRKSRTFFAQDIWDFSENLNIEGGLAYHDMDLTNSIQGTEWSEDELSPRLGLTYRTPFDTTLHFAAFTYLLPFQSDRLEPSSVAGIPVYRNGLPGSSTEEIHLMARHEWDSNLIQVSLFNVDRDYEQLLANGTKDGDETDWDGFEISLNQYFPNNIGHTLSFSYRDITDTTAGDGDDAFQYTTGWTTPDDRKEYEITDSVKWVHTSGFSAAAYMTYRDIDFDGSTRSDEHIFLVDVELEKELPGKSGNVRVRINNIFDEQFNWVTDQFTFDGRVPETEFMAEFSYYF